MIVHMFATRDFMTPASNSGWARHLEKRWQVEPPETQRVRPDDAASHARHKLLGHAEHTDGMRTGTPAKMHEEAGVTGET